MSAALAPGISLLVADLQRMVGLLDAVLFRELWRAVAVATTRTLFNDVVTECFFSEQVQPLIFPEQVQAPKGFCRLCIETSLATTHTLSNDLVTECLFSQQVLLQALMGCVEPYGCCYMLASLAGLQPWVVLGWLEARLASQVWWKHYTALAGVFVFCTTFTTVQGLV